MTTTPTRVDLWGEAQVAMSTLGRTLDQRDAVRPVPACPGWSVHAVFAHQAGVAADILAGRMDGVATDAWTQRQVDERAGRTLTEVLDEWDDAAPRLLAALGPLGDGVDPRLVVDLWTHHQDVRGALARPGERAGPVADWVAMAVRENVEQRIAGAGLPAVALDRVAPPFELVRAVVGRRSRSQVRGWAWAVDQPDPYVDLVPVFAPRDSDLEEPDQ